MNERHRTSAPSAKVARQLLDVPPDATEQDLRRAFRRAARAIHPDGGGTSGDLAALRAARDLLLAPHGDDHPDGRERVFVRRRRRLTRAAERLLQPRRHARRGANRKVR